MKNSIVFILAGVLVAFPIVFAQQESDGAAGGAVSTAFVGIIGSVVAVAAVAASVASSKIDACHTC